MLNIEIKSYYHGIMKKRGRKDIVQGNTKSLLNSVKKAKDLNVEPIPVNLYKGGNLVEVRCVCMNSRSFLMRR